MSSEATAAVIAGLVALILGGATAALTLLTSKRQLKHEVLLSEQRLRHEVEILDRRLRQELRTEFMAEEAIRRLLMQPQWNRRSFKSIKKTVGGFGDDQLRQLLVRSGALRFVLDGENEYWGLLERNPGGLDPAPVVPPDKPDPQAN